MINKKDIIEFKKKGGGVVSLFGNVKYDIKSINNPKGFLFKKVVLHSIVSMNYNVFVSEFDNKCVCSVIINGGIINDKIITKTFIGSILEAYKIIYSRS